MSTSIFLWGAAGSIAVDVLAALRIYEATSIKFPEKYNHALYYVCRLILAGIGGGLAIAYDIDKAILAINIGASAPLILTSLSQGIAGSVQTAVPQKRARRAPEVGRPQEPTTTPG